MRPYDSDVYYCQAHRLECKLAMDNFSGNSRMSNGIASAFEISARYLRDNTGDDTTARRLITERIHYSQADLRNDPFNTYLMDMIDGFQCALETLYKKANRS